MTQYLCWGGLCVLLLLCHDLIHIPTDRYYIYLVLCFYWLCKCISHTDTQALSVNMLALLFACCSMKVLLHCQCVFNAVNWRLMCFEASLKWPLKEMQILSLRLCWSVAASVWWWCAPSVVPQQDPEYMEQPSPTNDSKHLQEDTERAISRAAAEQEERSPEALLNAVCKTCKDTHYRRLTTSHACAFWF